MTDEELMNELKIPPIVRGRALAAAKALSETMSIPWVKLSDGARRWQIVNILTALHAADQVDPVRKQMEDFRDHGTRSDLNPTVDSRDFGSAYIRYIERIDQSVRDGAREALGESGSAGALEYLTTLYILAISIGATLYALARSTNHYNTWQNSNHTPPTPKTYKQTIIQNESRRCAPV